QFNPSTVMVSSFVTALVLMLTFTPALLGCLVATTHRSVVHTEGRFYGFCSPSRYIRTKLHPYASSRLPKSARSARRVASGPQSHIRTETARAGGTEIPSSGFAWDRRQKRGRRHRRCRTLSRG